MSGFRPRPGQREVLEYRGGKLGISAVPGSGKTRTLAELAAKLVARSIEPHQEVLVVTLVNSAVDNFQSRINEAVGRQGLLVNFGYRVRTLHGLSHDIVRERPGLVGLSEDFGILDEREAEAVRDEAAEAWLRAHPDSVEAYLALDMEGNRAEWVRRSQWPALVKEIAAAFIKRAKDLRLGPEVLRQRLEGLGTAAALALARMAVEIYADYQRSLAYRGAVDFDDLIWLALEALLRDTDYLARLRARWPYILEDEAQDSSQLQEEILRLLAGEGGNWVRVGDPNQAIYDTFTNADPRFLREFLKEPGVSEVRLLESGRSQPFVLDLANHLVDWTGREHPQERVRGAFVEQSIRPTGPGDPQPNPEADRGAIRLIERDYTPERELQVVADSLQRWLPKHGDWTVAVLSPRNQRGVELSALLQAREVPYVELLRSTSVTRQTAGALGNVLRCLADPVSARRLSDAFRTWRRGDRENGEAWQEVEAVAERLRQCPAVEAYLWPRADHDWPGAGIGLGSLPREGDLQDASIPRAWDLLTVFRETARRWHRAAALPIDQLVLTLAGELFRDPRELALAHKLAVLLRDVAHAHPTYRLAELVQELEVIARNERRFLGFSAEDSGFVPPEGVVTLATMHKAKGLEWDRVYLLSVNSYDYPSGQTADTYIAEKWYVRDGLNLEAEALDQLEALAAWKPGRRIRYVEGEATREARWAYVAERLRLLYVGITRARRELVVTWNKGRRRGTKLQAAVPLVALRRFWEEGGQEEVDGVA